MVAQIDEQHVAMVALAVDPARQLARARRHRLSRSCAAIVGTIGVHRWIGFRVD